MQGFKTKNAYDGHMMTHLESNPNQCHICNKVYRQAASLRSHILTHTGEKVSKKKYVILKSDKLSILFFFSALQMRYMWKRHDTTKRFQSEFNKPKMKF